MPKKFAAILLTLWLCVSCTGLARPNLPPTQTPSLEVSEAEFDAIFGRIQGAGLAYRSRLTQAQYRRRFILVGTAEEIVRMRADLAARSEEGIDIMAELNLGETSVEKLVSVPPSHRVFT